MPYTITWTPVYPIDEKELWKRPYENVPHWTVATNTTSTGPINWTISSGTTTGG